jgi:hypothetical protein
LLAQGFVIIVKADFFLDLRFVASASAFIFYLGLQIITTHWFFTMLALQVFFICQEFAKISK